MLWSSGVGHEVISAMAAPVLGGLLVSDEVVDLFLPVRFYWVRRHRWLKLHGLTEEQVEQTDVMRHPGSFNPEPATAALGEAGRTVAVGSEAPSPMAPG